MCGIIAVVRRPSTRRPPSPAEVTDRLEAAARLLGGLGTGASLPADLGDVLTDAAAEVAAADALLRGVAGVTALLEAPGLGASVTNLVEGLDRQTVEIEARLDADTELGGTELERVNAALISLKDAVWAVRRDRLRAAEGVRGLVGPGVGPAGLAVGLSVHQALSALDRLEVRGRDSAGLHLLVRGHGLDLDLAGPARRARGPRRRSRSSGRSPCAPPRATSASSTRPRPRSASSATTPAALREAMVADALLRQALAAESVEAVVLGHTRWASVGIISQPNAHPLNSEEVDSTSGPYVTAVLNGDVDNFADLKASEALHIAAEITTDAKVIPTLMSRGAWPTAPTVVEAFRSTVAQLEGSVAIAASAAGAPDDLLLALRGSGQALYVGLAEDGFIVATEPYGVVEETDDLPPPRRRDPGRPRQPRRQPRPGRGADGGAAAGTRRRASTRCAYDGTPPRR